MLFKKRKKDSAKTRQPRLMDGQDDYTFRRSRTLTGTVSSDISAAAESRSQLKSPRLKLHQLRRHRRGLLMGIGVIFLAVLGLGWLITQYIRNPEGSIRYSQQITETQSDTAEYGNAIEEYFAKHPLERFAFQLNQQKLLTFLQSEHPEVKNVELTASVDGIQDIALTFREPILSWKTNQEQLFIDNEGVAFRKNYFAAPTVTVEDKTGVEFTETGVAVSDRFMSFLGQMVGYINQGNIGKVTKVIIPAGTLRQIDIQLQGKSYLIKTNSDRDPYVQAQDVINAVKYIQTKGYSPQYIDARVEGRAFYRDS